MLIRTLAVLALLLIGCGDDPTFEERVREAETCAELEEVAADARDPGGINPEAILESADDNQTARDKEFQEGIGDSIAVFARAEALNC